MPTWLCVGARWTTAVHWLVVAMFVAAFWVAPFVPAVDLPQHVALGAVVHRLATSATDRAAYELNPLSYNALFDLGVAALSFIMTPETAGRLLVSLIPVLSAIAMLVLLAAAGRPSWYAFFALPASFSYVIAYGFVNYALGVPIALLTIARFLRWRARECGVGWVVFGALLCALAHPVVVLFLAVSIVVASLERDGVSERALRAVTPLLPAIVWVLVCRAHHAASPDATSMASSNGYDIPAWKKLMGLAENTLGDVGGSIDDALFLVAMAALAVLWVLRRRRESLTPLMYLWGVVYVLMPLVFMGAWAMFQRVSPFWLAFAVVAAPRAPRVARVTKGVAIVAASGVAVVTLLRFAQLDGRDAREVLDAVPADARLASVIYAWRGTPTVEHPIWIHYAAYALARQPIELGRSFARDYGDFVVRERDWQSKPRPSEWEPQKFDVTSAFGRRYTTVFVRTPDDAPGEDPSKRLFGARKGARVLAHRGRFWLFDTSGVQR